MSTSKDAEANLGEIKSVETKSDEQPALNEGVEAARSSVTSALSSTLNRLNQHYKAVVILASIQLIAAIVGIAWPCTIAFYTVIFNTVYNTFWVAGPMLLLATMGLVNKKMKYLAHKNIIVQEILTIICFGCLIGGIVFIVIVFDGFVARPKQLFADHECRSEHTPPKYSGFILVNLITTTILFGFYVYYNYVCKLTRDAYSFYRSAVSPSNNGATPV